MGAKSNKFGSIRIEWISTYKYTLKIISCIVCVYLYEQNDFNLKRHLQFYALKNTCHKHHIIVKFPLFFFFFYFFFHQLLNCADSFVILFLRIFFSIRSLFLNCTRHKHFLCYNSWDNWMDTICKKRTEYLFMLISMVVFRKPASNRATNLTSPVFKHEILLPFQLIMFFSLTLSIYIYIVESQLKHKIHFNAMFANYYLIDLVWRYFHFDWMRFRANHLKFYEYATHSIVRFYFFLQG